MAKVGVRIEGKETLSPEASSAAKSLRQLREETEALKKGAQNILQPLINLRSTIMSVGAAAGVIQGFRAIARELGESVQEYAKIDADFGKTMAETQKAMKGFKAEIGGLVAEIAGPLMQRITAVFGSLSDNLEQARNVRNAVREATAGNLSSDAQKIEDELEAVLKKMIAVWTESQQWYNKIGGASKAYYDEELSKLNLVREALLRQKAALEEVAEAKALVARITATGQEAAGIVADQDAATEAVRALIRGESELGKVLSLEQKLATLRSWSFENEARYEEARLEAIKRLQEEIEKLTGKIKGVIGSFDESEGDTFQLTISEGDIYRAWAQSVFDANEGDRYDVVPSSGDEERYRLQAAFDANEGDTFAVAPPLGQIRNEKYLAKFNEEIQEAIGGIGGFVGGLMNSVATMGPLGLLYEALKPVLAGILEVLGPAIEGVLAPLFGALVVIGKLIGTLLAPVFQILALVLDPVIELFVGAYNFLLPVFNLLGKGLGYLAVGVDAVSRPFEWLGDLVTWVGAKLAYWIDSLPLIGTGKLEDPGTFISDAFERPLIGNGWTDLTPIDTGTLTAEGVDYFGGTGGAFGGGYSGGSSGSGGTTVQQMPDITVNLTIQGSIYGAAGPREVGEEVARALEAYAGIGGRIRIEGALA